MAIVCPFRHRKSQFKAYCIIALVWLLAGILSLPALIYSTTITFSYQNQEERTICYLEWPDGPTGYSWSDYLYNVIFLVLTYIFPMAFMAVTYTWTGFVLWRSNAIGERTQVQMVAIKSKQRVVRMQIAVALLFGICWLPYHLYFIYAYQYPDVQRSAYIQEVFLGIYWLAMSHSMHNPIVYYWMNAKFRRYFRTVLCLCKGWRKRPSSFTTPPLTMSDSTRTRSCRIILPSSSTTNHKNHHLCSRCHRQPESNCYEL